jgi:hypothetical protein
MVLDSTLKESLPPSVNAPLYHFQALDEPQIPSGFQHGHITAFLISSSFMKNGWFFDVPEISITGGSLISICSVENTGNRWRFCDSVFFPTKNRSRWFFESP